MVEAQTVVVQCEGFSVERSDAAFTQYGVGQVGTKTEVENAAGVMTEAAFQIGPLKAQAPCQETMYH